MFPGLRLSISSICWRVKSKGVWNAENASILGGGVGRRATVALGLDLSVAVGGEGLRAILGPKSLNESGLAIKVHKAGTNPRCCWRRGGIMLGSGVSECALH